jgi:hypothetical protein
MIGGLKAALAQDAHRLTAIDVGQAHVHDHQIDQPCLGRLHAHAAVLHGQGLELLVQRQLFCQCIAHLGIVVDIMHLTITFGNELSQRSFSDSSCLRQLSCGQLVEQSLSLFQIERVETFGEPAVDRSARVGAIVFRATISRRYSPDKLLFARVG